MDCGCTCATTAARSTRASRSSACPVWRANAADFAPLAEALAAGAAGRQRRVIAVDYRGRGESDYDPDWRHYDLRVEGADILAQLAALEIHEAIFVGTSRGGLHIMALAAARPALVHAAVLNDVGPVIELQGLTRIRQYLRHPAAPNSSSDAVDYLRKAMSAQFTALSDADFERYARASFQEAGWQFRRDVRPESGEATRGAPPRRAAAAILGFVRGAGEGAPVDHSRQQFGRPVTGDFRRNDAPATAIARPMWLKAKVIRRCSPMTRRSRGSPTSSPGPIRLERGKPNGES